MMTLNKEIILDYLSGHHVIIFFFKIKESGEDVSDKMSEDFDSLLILKTEKKATSQSRFVPSRI